MSSLRGTGVARYALAAFFLLLAAYAFYELRGFVYGPRISLPSDLSTSSDKFITVRGSAQRIAELRMNGSPVAVTEEGAFEEPYLLAPGLNRIIFDAEDKYGSTDQETLEIYYQPPAEDLVPVGTGTSTPVIHLFPLNSAR